MNKIDHDFVIRLLEGEALDLIINGETQMENLVIVVMKLCIANPANSEPVKAFTEENDARAYCVRENLRQNDFYYLFYHLNVE